MRLYNTLRSLLLTLLFTTALTCATAQQQQRSGHPARGFEQTQSQNFETYLHSKCEMVIREIGLTSFDSAHFEPLYHQLQKEKMELYRRYGGMHRIRKALDEGRPVADTTLMRVISNSAKLQVEDALLEQTYLNKFARVLTPMQLYRLQQAEQNLRKQVIRQGRPARK